MCMAHAERYPILDVTGDPDGNFTGSRPFHVFPSPRRTVRRARELQVCYVKWIDPSDMQHRPSVIHWINCIARTTGDR
ncbi:hypothetical protein GCK32_003364 [Trichostrongylus colubriformis]|uniref:Uncharacterized protein n=1 Tax=Trichostrongylus colubriformis TaxID=6319 RepID=A0AAN8FI02_TRICO